MCVCHAIKLKWNLYLSFKYYLFVVQMWYGLCGCGGAEMVALRPLLGGREMCRAPQRGDAGVPVESLHEVRGEWTEICAEKMCAGYDAGNKQQVLHVYFRIISQSVVWHSNQVLCCLSYKKVHDNHNNI